MKDEIKEILDRLERIDHKEYSCDFEFADSATFDEMARCFEERKKMADYITNFQQDYSKAMELIDKGVENSYKMLKDYKSRCEKAIEYINHAQNYGTMAQVMPHLKSYVNGDDLLNILQNGSDSE